jgi:hypothetical protein
MKAILEIPIGVPSWLLKDFSGMLQCPGGEMLKLIMVYFHFGGYHYRIGPVVLGNM